MAMIAIVLGAALLGFAGGWAWQATGAGRGATEEIVRDYILEHPEVLPEAMERLMARETLARIEPLREMIETPFPGAVLGNPEGSVTLVEFTDYACPYCRSSVGDVKALVAQDKDLKVVVREYPILSSASVDAARMALAAAEQGRFAEFHEAMFAKDRPTVASIDAAAREAGLDLAKAKAAIATGRYDAELATNSQLADATGLTATPAWIVGQSAFSGAVGRERLEQAVRDAKGS